LNDGLCREKDKLMVDYQCSRCAGIIGRGGELPENE
jgi:hypothetical protein